MIAFTATGIPEEQQFSMAADDFERVHGLNPVDPCGDLLFIRNRSGAARTKKFGSKGSTDAMAYSAQLEMENL